MASGIARSVVGSLIGAEKQRHFVWRAFALSQRFEKEGSMSMNRNLNAFVIGAIVLCCTMVSAKVLAAEPAVNTGNTSFMDGFGDPTGYGFTYMNYLSWANARSFKDPNGNDVPVFVEPRLNAIVDLNQFLYSFRVPDSFIAQPGIDVIVPLVDLNSSFGAGGEALKDNGFGLGDITFGPFMQFKPILVDHRPVFAHRLEFDVVAPTGKYDPTKQINPGSNTWAINPYWAATLIPIARVEISTRFNYLYNFKNTDPVRRPGGGPSSTQEGQAIFDNFAVAYEILAHNETRAWAHSLRFGLNGYYFKQITQSKVDGNSGSGTLEQTLGLGPGAMWVPTSNDAFWLNVYFETAVKNRFAGDMFQIRWAHSFASF
jgi:hypothetical protein